MDEKGFRGFIKEGKRVPKDLPEETVRDNIRAARAFESFLRRECAGRPVAKARAGDVRRYMASRSAQGKGSFAEYLGVLRYARFVGNEAVELALLTALDGANVVGDLCDAVGRIHGKEVSSKVLKGFVRPPVGTPPKRMPAITCDFMDRLETALGEEDTRKVLLTGVHAAPPEHHAHERKMLLEAGDIDSYMRMRREGFIELLEGHAKDGTLFFDQRIDQDVVDYVRRNPEVAGGVRRGRRIYQTKIQFRATEYLKEKDLRLKRYYGCHCPLARESILTGKEMSRNLCYCSAGYEARPYEVAFGKPVKIEVLKSILWGDTVCRFAIDVPEEHLPKARGKRARPKGRRGKA